MIVAYNRIYNRMDIEQIKLYRLTNQHLLEPADCITVVRDLCGIQAQFLSNALHAIRIRSTDMSADSANNLIRSWAIRGTMHIFAQEDLPLMLYKGRNHFLRPCDTMAGDESITHDRKVYFSDLIIDSIAAGITARDELKEVCFSHGMSETEAESIFNAWGGLIRALCESGRICYTIQKGKSLRICPEFEPLETDTAQIELARRYFTNYAPATIKDASYFFATTQAQVKKWLSQLPITSTICDGKQYFSIATGMDYNYNIAPCIFLAGFDPLMLGYRKDVSLYLPEEHIRKVFTLTGIIKPTVLYYGKIIGTWSLKRNKLTITPFEPLSAQVKKQIEDHAQVTFNESVCIC